MSPKLLLCASVLTLAGCATVPPEIAAELKVASQRYATATVDMTRAEFVRVLGDPQKDDGTTAVWEARYDDGNFDSLSVVFTPEGRVKTMTKTHSRRTRGPGLNYERSYSYTK